MEIVKAATGPAVVKASEEKIVLLDAPEDVNGVVEDGTLYQVHSGVLRVPESVAKMLKDEPHNFKDHVPKKEALTPTPKALPVQGQQRAEGSQT